MADGQHPPGSTEADLVSEIVGDYDVLELLDRLLHLCADRVGAAGAAVLSPDGDGRLQVLAATSETAVELELFQTMSGEGPAFDCLATRGPVLEPDLSGVEERWPRFAPAARAAGMRGVGSVWMGVRGTSVGALNLFDPAVTSLDELAAVQGLADVAVLAVLQAGRALDEREVLQHVRRTMDGRVVVEQAKGVVAEWTGLSPDEAGAVLLAHVRRTGSPLSEVARRVLALEVDPAELGAPAG